MDDTNSNCLSNRQLAEKAYHEMRFAHHKRRMNFDDLGFKSIIFGKVIEKLGNLEGKTVAECGCGEGWFTKILASMGAEVWAFDISDEALSRTSDFLTRLNLQKHVHLNQMAAEKLSYESNKFDYFVGNAILHHLDAPLCLKEIKRVLKPGGKAFFTEPLGYNPFLNIYRKMTPHLRSKDETPLRFAHFKLFRQYFPDFWHEEFYLLTTFAVLWNFIGANKMMFKTRDMLHKIDTSAMQLFPSLKKYCWYSIIEFRK